MTIKNLFSTPVSVDDISEKHGELLKNFYAEIQGLEDVPFQGVLECDTPYARQLRVVVQEYADGFAQKTLAAKKTALRGSWVMNQGFLDSMPIHAHPSYTFVGTLYLQAPKDCGDLQLLDPRNGVLWRSDTDVAENGVLTYRDSVYQVPVSFGTLVFFPGYVLHGSGVNKTHTTRSVLAMNFSVMQGDW